MKQPICLMIASLAGLILSPSSSARSGVLTSQKQLAQAPEAQESFSSGQSHTKIGYEKFLRLNEPQNKTKNSDWFDLSHSYRFQRSSLEGAFNGDLRFYINNSDISPSLSEAYIKYKGDNGSTYSLGRQKLDWHPNESFWQLDHFQNTRGFRLMDMKAEGLTGFHYQTQDGALKTEVFLSYFYIPGLNPSVKVEDGQVLSNTDWYKRPPERTIVAGQEVDIFYNLNMPEIRDVLVQKSLGMRMSIDWGEKRNLNNGLISGFAIYKPERRLRINAEAFYEPTLDSVLVNATPVVNHHVMFGGELRQLFRNYEFIAGAITIDPNARLGKDFDSLSLEIENTRTTPSEFFSVEPLYNRETYAHSSLTFKNSLSLLSVNYLRYFSEHEKPGNDFYGETVKWKNAIGLGGSHQFNDWLQGTFNFRYDLEREDNLLNTQLIFLPWRQSTVTLGSELIRSPQTNSYWSAYRANDTFYLNVGYIF